jgi:hypothetical protein
VLDHIVELRSDRVDLGLLFVAQPLELLLAQAVGGFVAARVPSPRRSAP